MRIKPEAEKIVGYVRVSTDDQADHRTSLDSQEAQIRADAEAKGQIVVRVFVDAGESGQDARRPEFNRLLDFVEDPANNIHEVKIFSLSRLARSMETQVQTFARLKRAKVRLHSLTQNFSDDAMGGMLRNLIASFDEYFALETAKHTRRTMRRNAEEGFFNGGPVPFGYESRTVEMRGTKAKKKLFVHDDNARTVRLIFDLTTIGEGNGVMGARAIAEWLNERGYTLSNGNKFNNSNVAGILGRYHYRGYYFDMTRDEQGGQAPEDQWVRVECPQIIPGETMDAVAALRAVRRPTVTPPRTVNGPTLLTKVARCGICGEGMTIRTGKSGSYSYYSCNGKVSAGAARCACPHVREERLDAVVLGALERQIFAPERLRMLLSEMLEASAEADERRARDLTQARLHKTQAETRLRNLYEALADGHASLKEATFTGLLAETNGRIASATATIDTLERQIGKATKRVTPEMVDAFGELVRERLRGEDPALRKAYVALFVSEVAVDQEEIRISGSSRLLERAVGRAEPAIMGMVPIFDRKWCPEEDSNLHDLAIAST
jgi:site-specific DNA recombinase